MTPEELSQRRRETLARGARGRVAVPLRIATSSPLTLVHHTSNPGAFPERRPLRQDRRITLRVSQSLIDMLDSYAASTVTSRSEAIRTLLWLALQRFLPRDSGTFV